MEGAVAKCEQCHSQKIASAYNEYYQSRPFPAFEKTLSLTCADPDVCHFRLDIEPQDSSCSTWYRDILMDSNDQKIVQDDVNRGTWCKD